MSQNDFSIANQGFPSFRSDLNDALQALASNSSGTSAPSTTYAYQWWYDETNDILKIRNSANDAWIDFATFDQTTDTWSFASVTVDGDLTVDTNTLYVDSANNRVGIGTSSPSSALDVQGDIEVSGGVYLGGTGSANYLDDYEEGTFTATLESAGNTGVTTLTSNVAKYTKIGDVVYVFCTVTGDANLCDAGDYFEIGGLPFTATSYANSRSPFNGVSRAGATLIDNRNATGVCSVFEGTTRISVCTNVAAIGSSVGETICTLTVCYTVA